MPNRKDTIRSLPGTQEEDFPQQQKATRGGRPYPEAGNKKVSPDSGDDGRESRAAIAGRELMAGIAINVVLTVCKFVIGTATHCAALTADGFKDLADIARAGLKLELQRLRRNVREHRERSAAATKTMELLCIIVFAAIAYVGIHSLIGSVADAIDTHDTRYTPALFIISGLASS